MRCPDDAEAVPGAGNEGSEDFIPTDHSRASNNKHQSQNLDGLRIESSFATKYDETNPRLRTTIMADDHDHGDVTRLHLSTTDRIFARANPFIWNMPDWYLHRIRLFSKASASHPGLHNARIGLASKSRYRMYPYTAQNPCHEPICMTSSVT